MHMPKIIAVGGTIDAKEYDFSTGEVVSFAMPAVISIVEKVRPDIPLGKSFHMCEQKDSDIMTDEDRLHIVELCKNFNDDRIVITHGTGTMIDTGLLLAKHIKDKTIVLTGSLPYTYDAAYASFNVGSAITACQLLSAGVYIVMNGEIVNLQEQKAIKIKDANVTYFIGK